MIRCDKCGAYGSPRMSHLPPSYYKDYCEDGTPILIGTVDNGGQLCQACFDKDDITSSMEYLEKVRKGGR